MKTPFDFAVEDYVLAPATYYRVGGPARLALFPTTIEEAAEAYRWMLEQPVPHLVVGNGSNILVADAGFSGMVLFTTKLTRIESLGGGAYNIEAGVLLGTLVRDVLLPNNYDGVGALAGIPGSVGGAIFMNAGTVNGSTCQWLESVEIAGAGGLRECRTNPLMYGYRGQTFCPRGDLILRGSFRFAPVESDQRAVYEHYVLRRTEKQPQGYCCGSVFRNPEGDHAGRLIEACGLKGTRQGGAVISPKHANFIMNEGGATCEDILRLMALCKQRVREQFGIELQEEVVIVR